MRSNEMDWYKVTIYSVLSTILFGFCEILTIAFFLPKHIDTNGQQLNYSAFLGKPSVWIVGFLLVIVYLTVTFIFVYFYGRRQKMNKKD